MTKPSKWTVFRLFWTISHLILHSISLQDIFGNAPLHIATCQSNIPWECILNLLENGAQICLANHRGIRPIDLTLKPILQRLQSRVVDSCWTNLVESNSQHHGEYSYSSICVILLMWYTYHPSWPFFQIQKLNQSN